MSGVITLHEHTGDAGELVRSQLMLEDGQLTLVTHSPGSHSAALPLPAGALEAVMKRFGKPLESGEVPRPEETLDLGEGRSLIRFRFLRRYDVIARDYLVLLAPGAEPLCEMATSVTAALEHLGRRLAARDEP